jgi:predicted amidohydrolase
VERCRVAAVQVRTRRQDVAHNLAEHVRVIDEAATAGCDLVVFPELSVTGHNGSIEVIRDAEPLHGPIAEQLTARAAECGVVVGYGFCEAFRGTHYNTYALVGPEGLLGVQRKVHASFDEFFRFRQAYEWNVIDVGSFRAGVAICHDSDFFESWRILALRGAEVVLLPHARRKLFAADGTLRFDGAEHEASPEELLAAQRSFLDPATVPPRLQDVLARDNGVYAVYADHVGFDGHSTHVGGAFVLGPDGSTVASSEPGLDTSWVVAELDPALLARVRENPVFPLRKRRPEVYDELTLPL